jgi:AraC-like DNA-binding protein
VRDVATSVGYRQAAQFAKTFRRHHGRPPSSIRRERYTTAAVEAVDGGPPRSLSAQVDRSVASGPAAAA